MSEVKICSLNIQGQSQLDIAKQFQIEHFIQKNGRFHVTRKGLAHIIRYDQSQFY